jgi:hypothetical protein
MPRRTPPRGPERPPPADDPVRAQNVLIEEMRSQMKLVVEHVDMRVDGLERKLDDSTKAIRVDIADLTHAVTQLRHDFDHRPERGRLGR